MNAVQLVTAQGARIRSGDEWRTWCGQGAVHTSDLRIAETERGDGVNASTGKVRIERLSIEFVAGGYEGEVVIGGAGTQIGWVRSINLYKPSLAKRGKGQSKSPV